MMTPEQFEDMAAALRAFDRTLSVEESESMAAQIGDTPEVLDGMIHLVRGGAAYEVPAEVVLDTEI
jgi:hypothetical protein